jgi:hypothetical protein
MRRRAWCAPFVAALFPAAVLAGGIQGIEVLSNRADVISGGDALVAVRLGAGVDPAAVKVTLNGHDVTGMFAVRQNRQYAALVTGLAEGDNQLRARLPDGSGHEITIKNHPIGGPVFSGEQIQPWLCRTQLQGGTTPALGASVDDKCNAAAPVVEHFYRNVANTQWVAYNPSSPPAPELIGQTTTDQGKTVPFIIQRVTGTANRGIYQIAVLVDPTKPIEPWSVEQPWNRKYVNTFGGACSVNYQQPTVGDVRNVARLGLGFAVGTSSLNTYGNSCSDVISAEALMMTKEIVTERWGPILYTLGDGGSAGTMQQHMISGAYPGLLNGLMTSLLYEDHWFQVVDSFDCLMLSRYFGLGGAPAGWGGGGNALFNTPALRQLVYGTNPSNPDAKCSQKIGFTTAELIADSSAGCAGPAGSAWRWPNDPNGARCTIQDYMKYVFGVGPDNKAPRPIDNVGLQYGLASLLNGTLTKDRFVDVNWRIGGMDIDGVWQPQRTAADLGALAALYRTGRIADGSGAAYVAEIDNRNNPTDVGFHPPFHSWSWRARIDRTLGNHDNNVIWVSRGGTLPSQFDAMRAWLDAVYADASSDPLPVKIARSKPANVRDTCYASDAQGGPQDDLFCTGTAAQWQYFSHMRWVAGWPMELDTFKCQLKPLSRLDYVLPTGELVNFTEEEWDKLNQAFPTGVCDFTRPSVAHQPSLSWVSFAGGPGGEPLGDAPASSDIPVSTRLAEQLELVAGVQGGSFAAQLAGVKEKYEAGELTAACGQLGAYRNHVRAQSGRRLSASLAETLLVNAAGIAAAIGCRG